MAMNNLLCIKPMDARKLKCTLSLRWRALLRKIGLKTGSSNLIMVDFAHHDPRSVVNWLHGSGAINQQGKELPFDVMLDGPILSNEDIRKCLGHNVSADVETESALPNKAESPC